MQAGCPPQLLSVLSTRRKTHRLLQWLPSQLNMVLLSRYRATHGVRRPRIHHRDSRDNRHLNNRVSHPSLSHHSNNNNKSKPKSSLRLKFNLKLHSHHPSSYNSPSSRQHHSNNSSSNSSRPKHSSSSSHPKVNRSSSSLAQQP